MASDSSNAPNGNILPDMEDEPEAKSTTQTTGQKRTLPKSEFWLNLGVVVNGVFASLPYGVAVDNMKIQSIPPPLLEGTEEQKQAREEFRSRRAISNQLVEHLQALMGKMTAGEDIHLPALTVSLHKVKPKTAEEVKVSFTLPTGFSLTASPVKAPEAKVEPEAKAEAPVKEAKPKGRK